jgi:hypothetical protein
MKETEVSRAPLVKASYFLLTKGEGLIIYIIYPGGVLYRNGEERYFIEITKG